MMANVTPCHAHRRGGESQAEEAFCQRAAAPTPPTTAMMVHVWYQNRKTVL
jgi:hypothetical protein